MVKTITGPKQMKPIQKSIDWKTLYEETMKNAKDVRKKYDILNLYSERISHKIKSLEDQIKMYKEEEFKKTDKLKKEIMKEKEIRTRDVLIKQMQFELKKQRDLARLYNFQIETEQEFNAIKSANKIPVIIINDFTKEDILVAHREFGINNQAVWFRNIKSSSQALNTLIDLHPKVVLNPLNEYSDDLRKKGIVTLDLKPEIHGTYGSLPAELLQNTIREKERKDFTRWLDESKKR